MSSTMPGDPVDFDKLQAIEHEAIQSRRDQLADGDVIHRHSPDMVLQTTGLSLSGGGIRSACFSLGLLEGLDRLAYAPADETLRTTVDANSDWSHLEYFDYVSSVSGGSYATGHLATAMLPSGGGDEKPAWLGRVELTSKTVPGWLWGVGVWFLGVVFQLLKTGALLVAVLALLAFAMRILDAPAANRFWYVVGMRTDVTRGFIPFWVALGIFLTAYGFHASPLLKRWRVPWFLYTSLVVILYLAAVWFMYEDVPGEATALPFDVHYAFLLALVVPIICFCLRVLLLQAYRWGRTLVAPSRAEGAASRPAPTEDRDQSKRDQLMQNVLLVPVLVALFCVAALMATGDIKLGGFVDPPDDFRRLQDKGEWFGELGNRIYELALGALGIVSIGFLFPRRLFQSARIIENKASEGRGEETKKGRLGLEPVFRVVVFLCSYGFVLLVVFVLFSRVAMEDVSSYMDWRNILPSAALHPSEFRSWDQAWEQIARDANEPPEAGDDAAEKDWGPIARDADEPADAGGDAARTGWGPVARLLLQARDAATDDSLIDERNEAAELRILDSMPWFVRLAPPLMHWGPDRPWKNDGYAPSDGRRRLYELQARADRRQLDVARRIALDVLRLPDLYEKLPPVDAAIAAAALGPDTAEGWRAAWDGYLRKAESLAALADNASPGTHEAIDAAVANNNREVLRLYLPQLIRDRAKKQVFAWIVWRQDQWTRLRIFAVAAILWGLCCAVDVNTYGLQKFYRGHVIDSWVGTTASGRMNTLLWLDEDEGTYRGHEFNRPRSPAPTERRAPLLLINATLEGNRSLGDEPNLTKDVFTFSQVASGSGETGYWPNGDRSEGSFIRCNGLDVGNMVATSGAFLSPGTIANPALSAVLHLLNIQTGYWIHDPRKFRLRTPWESFKFHVSQSLGVDRGGDSRYMLTDGAHVENLGLYVLLQRRCSLIVASDCSQEDRAEKPEHRFDALIRVLQQAGVDGVEFGPFLNSTAYAHWIRKREIAERGGPDCCARAGAMGLDLVRPPDRPTPPPDPAAAPPCAAMTVLGNRLLGSSGEGAAKASPATVATTKPYAQEHYVFAQIVYPEGAKGLLVYLRPTLTGDEGDGLLHAAVGSSFPDDDPMDQFYEPAKMNTYRLLGRHIATELMHDPVMRSALRQFKHGDEPIDGALHDDHPPCDCCAGQCQWRCQPRLRSWSSGAGANGSQREQARREPGYADAPRAEANGQAGEEAAARK